MKWLKENWPSATIIPTLVIVLIFNCYYYCSRAIEKDRKDTILTNKCVFICNDHRVISCINDRDNTVATCADASSPSGYVVKSQ